MGKSGKRILDCGFEKRKKFCDLGIFIIEPMLTALNSIFGFLGKYYDSK
jgi:hypothetical protein